MNDEINKENCGVSETTPSLPQKICQSSCKICQSPCLEEIHQMKLSGMRFSKIVSVVKQNHSYDISESSLSRHFTNYFKIRDDATNQILKNDLMPDAVKRAAHSSAITRLIDNYLKLLEERFKLGIVKVNVSDLQKLMDIRYKILDANDENDQNLTVIFENFFNKYKLDTAQGELGLRSPVVDQRTDDAENSEGRKEAERRSEEEKQGAGV